MYTAPKCESISFLIDPKIARFQISDPEILWILQNLKHYLTLLWWGQSTRPVAFTSSSDLWRLFSTASPLLFPLLSNPSSNPLLVKLPRSQLATHHHTSVPHFSCLWHWTFLHCDLPEAVLSHSSLQVFKEVVHYNLISCHPYPYLQYLLFAGGGNPLSRLFSFLFFPMLIVSNCCNAGPLSVHTCYTVINRKCRLAKFFSSLGVLSQYFWKYILL